MEEIKNTAVIIDGMARSGTSALTNVVRILGVHMGDVFIQARPVNELGFFEDQEIWRLNGNIRKLLKINWNDYKKLMSDDEVLTRFNHLHPNFKNNILFKLNAILDKRSKIPLWGFKNPGVSELLSIWLPEITKRNTDIKIIVTIRHPADVAQSWHEFTRGSQSYYNCLRLWLRYTIGIEVRSRNLPRMFMDYKDLMENTIPVVDKLINFLDLKIDNYEGKIDSIENFLTPSLRKQNEENKDEWGNKLKVNDLYQICISVYNLLSLDNMTLRDRIYLDDLRRNF